MGKRLCYCSFCGRNNNEVFTLIAGPTVFICDECVAMAQKIITDKKIVDGCEAVAEASV